MSPLENMEASGPEVKHGYEPQQDNEVEGGRQGNTGKSARSERGARDHNYERIKGRVSPLDNMEASGPKIKRCYRPQQDNLVVLVTIATSG